MSQTVGYLLDNFLLSPLRLPSPLFPPLRPSLLPFILIHPLPLPSPPFRLPPFLPLYPFRFHSAPPLTLQFLAGYR